MNDACWNCGRVGVPCKCTDAPPREEKILVNKKDLRLVLEGTLQARRRLWNACNDKWKEDTDGDTIRLRAIEQALDNLDKIRANTEDTQTLGSFIGSIKSSTPTPSDCGLVMTEEEAESLKKAMESVDVKDLHSQPAAKLCNCCYCINVRRFGEEI